MNIRTFRERKGLTQMELARAVGVTQGCISQWEMGATHPSFRNLRNLARVLDATVDDIVGEETA